MAAKTFEEWIHDGLENEHVPTDSHGWLRRAWEAATNAAEERFTSHNTPSTPCQDFWHSGGIRAGSCPSCHEVA